MTNSSKKGRLRKWLNRLGALAIWVYAIYINSSLLAKWQLPWGIDAIFDQEYRPFRLLFYVLATVLIMSFKGKRSLLYVLFFPFWVLWRVVKFILRLFGLNMKLLSSAASLRVFITSIALIVVCYFAIHDSAVSYVVYPSVALLVFLSLLVVYGVFLWAMRPLAGLCTIMEKMNEHFCKQAPKVEEEIGNAEKYGDKAKLESKLKEEQNWLKIFKWIERAILTPQRVFGLFCIVLAFSVCLVGLNYSVAYWGMNKISPSHFAVVDSGVSFWDFSYFSLMVMTTSDLSGILPATPFTKILAASQLLCSVILLSMLVLAFTSSGHTDVGTAKASLRTIVCGRQEVHDRIVSSGAIEEAEVEEIEDDSGE